MAKIRLLTTGTKCTDSPTGMKGTITHIEILKEGVTEYLFRPEGLNPETSLPLESFPVEVWRLNVTDSDFEEREIPIEDIGKVFKDKVTTYVGTVVATVIHLNGCLHYVLQAQGINKSKNRIQKIEVDPRSCEGAKVAPGAPPSPEGEYPQDSFGSE